MSRRVRWLLGAALTINLAAVLTLGYLYSEHRQWYIDQRYSLFSRIETDVASLDIPPPQRGAAGFLADSPEMIERGRARLMAELPALRELPADFASWSTLDRAKRLATIMSRGGGAPPPETALLAEKFHWLHAGFGYCSDHTECHIALCSIFDVPAYESSSSTHTTTAIYSAELKKWVWMDPQFLLLARDADGRLLSPFELRDANLRGTAYDFEYFGDPGSPMAETWVESLWFQTGPENLRDFVVPWGNNVFEVDAWRAHLTWLPKPVRQIAYIALGIMPRYRIYSDEHAAIPARLATLRAQRWSAGLVIMAVNVLAAAAWWRGRRAESVEHSAVAAAPQTAGALSQHRAGA